jgi:hypothetical protein
MLRHACGFKLANDGVDTTYGALHRAGTDSVRKLIPGLTAPAHVALFEATVGGSRLHVRLMRSPVPRAAKEIKRDPSLPPLQKVGPPVPESHKNWGPKKL